MSLDDMFNRKLEKITIKRVKKEILEDGNTAYVNEEKSLIVPLYDRRIVFTNQADDLPEYDFPGDVIVNILVKRARSF